MTRTDNITVLQNDLAMLAHSAPRIGMRITGNNITGSNTTAMSTTLKFTNDYTQVTAERERENSAGYSRYQLVNWYVAIVDPTIPDEDQPDKVATISLPASPPGFRMDIATIKLEDGTDMDVLTIVNMNYILTYNVNDPTNPILMDTAPVEEEYIVPSFTGAGFHNLKMIDPAGTPRAVLLNQGEANLQCCQHFGISMSGWVARDSVVVGYVSPICENSTMSISPYGSAIGGGSYDAATGRIELNISDVACGHGIITITDNNTCCVYSTSHAVMVTTFGAWCAGGYCAAWTLQCTTNEFSCTCTYYEGMYKKSWYTGWGHPGSCLGVGSIAVGCGCGYGGCGGEGCCGNPGNYCPCSGSIVYVNAGNPPHCDGCTNGAHVASASVSCWSSGCGCESGEYDHLC